MVVNAAKPRSSIAQVGVSGTLTSIVGLSVLAPEPHAQTYLPDASPSDANVMSWKIAAPESGLFDT